MINGNDIKKKFAQLASQRQPLDEKWRECFDYTFPIRGQAFYNNTDPFSNASGARAKEAKIYDSTASDSSRLLASSMIAGLTPNTQQWFSLSIPNVPDAMIPRNVREWLQSASETIHSMIHSSNYNAQAFEFFIDIAVGGMCGLYVEWLEEEQRLLFEQWALSSLYVMDSRGKGMIDTVYRKVFFTPSEAVAKFGKDKLPKELRECYEKDNFSSKLFPFVHTIHPRNTKKGKGNLAKNLPFASVYVCEKSGEVVYEGGFHEFPVIIPRWLIVPGTDYATGPLQEAMPDVKTLNKVVEMMLSNAEMAIAGTFVAKDDGVLNPNTIKIGPRRVVFTRDVGNIKPLASGGDFRIGTAEIQRLQFQIRKAMLSDQLEATTQERTLSAEQVAQRTAITRQVMSPIFNRLSAEFLNPLIERCFGLAFRAGALGMPPEELMSFSFSPEYRSPLAKAQRLGEVQAMDMFEASLFNVMNATQDPSVLDVYDMEKALQKRSEILSIPVELIREQREVQMIRQQRAQAQQQAEMAQMAQQGMMPQT